MRMLDFFGDQNVGKYFLARGWEVITLVDGDKSGILEWSSERILEEHGTFDMMWINPPCKTFGRAGNRHHYYKDGTFKTEQAERDYAIAVRVVEIIEDLSDHLYFMENPIGKLGNFSFTQNLPKYQITYCQYGDFKQKATHIWTNHPNPNLRAPCKAGQGCHQASKKGMKNTINTQSRHEAKQLPDQLVEAIYLLSSDPRKLTFNFNHVEEVL